jgi:muramoyltetrapeptide carboxypeptidase
VKPAALIANATIGIIAPASSLDEASVKKAVANLRARGYRVKLSLGYQQRRGYLAASDEVRAAEINGFFTDDEVDAILCLRGGYGSPRILDRLDYDTIRRNPKIIVGYSDITALLNAIHRRSGLVVFHGPMAKEFSVGSGPTQYTEKYYWSAFAPSTARFDDWGGGGPRGRGALSVLVGGTAEGVLVGGNLSMLVSTIGTPYEIDARGKILFLEDVNEKAFRLDRMLNQLRLSGKLGQFRGVILGSFRGCGDDLRETTRSLEDLFVEYFGGLGIPVITGFPTGHTPDQVVMPIGVRVRLDADARKLSILESAVRIEAGDDEIETGDENR